MKRDQSRYSGYRFPPQIMSSAVWAYHRFCLSFRDVEDLLAERAIIVFYETIRQWCQKFGPDYARRLKRRQGRLSDHWHLDEVFIRINGQQQYLWRAVDQDGDVIDILVQPRRDRHAAERFFRKLLRGQGAEPLRIISDKLRSYSAALRSIFGNVTHSVERYANNRAERHISRRANENGKCADSNPHGTPSGFSRSTIPSRIYSEWAGTY
jgi:putative transposase